MAAGPELVARLGLDKSNYSKGLGDAEKDFRNFSTRTSAEGHRLGGKFAETFHGVHKALAAFGAVAVFREMVDGFKSISEWAQKFGDKTDSNVRAASRWSQGWSTAIDAVKSKGAVALGVLAKMGYAIGGALQGKSPAQIAKEYAAEDASDVAAEAAEAQAAAKKKANEGAPALRVQLAKKEEETKLKQMTSEQKLAYYSEQGTKTAKERNSLDRTAIDFTQKDLELKLRQEDINEAVLDVMKEQTREADDQNKKDKEQAAERERTHQREMEQVKELEDRKLEAEKRVAEVQTRQADKGKLTLRELASLDIFGAGTSVAAGQQGEKARQVADLDRKAEEARLSGDTDSFTNFQAQAAAITDALHGPGGLLKSTDHPAEDTNVQLEEANRQLGLINDKLKGKFVAEE